MASESQILAELLAYLPSREGYTPMDRYRDFRKVFGTVEGKRVLSEIVSWGGILRAPVLGKPVDPYSLAISFGERNLALKLTAAVHIEPVEKPTRQSRKKA